MTLVNNYICKALDAYPYELEETMEALHYALSYDDKNTMALCLMARIYAENLGDYEKAKSFYNDALTENIHAFHVYPYYINVLLWNEDYNEAERFIDFALTVKGSDKAVLYHKKAILFEKKVDYKKALEFVKAAKQLTYNSNYMNSLNETKSRIKAKMPKKKKKVKAKSKNKKNT